MNKGNVRYTAIHTSVKRKCVQCIVRAAIWLALCESCCSHLCCSAVSAFYRQELLTIVISSPDVRYIWELNEVISNTYSKTLYVCMYVCIERERERKCKAVKLTVRLDLGVQLNFLYFCRQEANCCLHLQDRSSLKMDAAHSFETWMPTYLHSVTPQKTTILMSKQIFCVMASHV
jgi:hypothetical protein